MYQGTIYAALLAAAREKEDLGWGGGWSQGGWGMGASGRRRFIKPAVILSPFLCATLSVLGVLPLGDRVGAFLLPPALTPPQGLCAVRREQERQSESKR